MRMIKWRFRCRFQWRAAQRLSSSSLKGFRGLRSKDDPDTDSDPDAEGAHGIPRTSKDDYDNDNENTFLLPSFSGLTGESRQPPPATQPDVLDARLRGHDTGGVGTPFPMTTDN
jgi:hypothetical protein